MRIISFAWTTPALLAGAKSVTRRKWADSYASTFCKGEQLQAWDRSPRTGKGARVGTIELTRDLEKFAGFVFSSVGCVLQVAHVVADPSMAGLLPMAGTFLVLNFVALRSERWRVEPWV